MASAKNTVELGSANKRGGVELVVVNDNNPCVFPKEVCYC